MSSSSSPDKSDSIVIMGLSDDAERYSYKAAQRLIEHGYKSVKGVHPSLQKVLQLPVVPNLEAVSEPIHTLTMYLNPQRIQPLMDSILRAKPKRIIFNPGSEHPALMKAARQRGIQVLEACTLVLLATKQF